MRRSGDSENRCAITGVPSSQADIEHQAVAVDAQMQRVGPAVVADWREVILLEQIVDRDLALVLDVRHWSGRSKLRRASTATRRCLLAGRVSPGSYGQLRLRRIETERA